MNDKRKEETQYGQKEKPITPSSTSDGWGGDPIEVEHIASFYHSDPIESKTILDWDEAQEDKETISGSLIEPIKIGDEKDGWKQFVSLCVAYRKEFGRAPTFIAIYRGKPLGQWCEAAQKAHKTNRNSGLSSHGQSPWVFPAVLYNFGQYQRFIKHIVIY